MFQITKNVPLPKPKKGPGSPGAPRKYPLPAMAVGESFFVPARGVTEQDAVVWRARSAIQYFRRNNPEKRFSIRRMADRVGVWRTA